MNTRSLLLLTFLFAPLLQAAVIIDSFSSVAGGDPDSVFTTGSAFGTPTDFTITPGVTDPVGSRRRLQADALVGAENASITIDGSGVGVLGSSANSASMWTLTYGIGFTGLHLDAAAGGATAFRLTFDSFSPTHEFVIGASGYTAVGTSNGGVYQAINSNVIDVPFSSFSNAANIDFHDLNQLQLIVRNMGLTRGGTTVITQFETVVPEPSRTALAGLSLAFLLMRRRPPRPPAF